MQKSDNVKTELLSPAGSFEALRAAVQSGADAVYIGEKQLSARKNAENFTWEEIRTAAEYCHIRGVKLYLALNTLMRSGEEAVVEEAVSLAAENGIDGLIIQDLGVAEIARRVCPSLPRHASTQLSAHSVMDVMSLMEKGFSRVVLSRELSESEISRIYAETGCEIEAFAHGALCVSFSGRCLMSSFIGGRSGNRGCCAQPCRQRYSFGGKQGYFLSPRDLCLVRRLEDMKKAGVISFKIEGRMKSPEYVAVVTDVYRRALDGQIVTADDEKRLRDIFSRGDGFTEGYFSGINTPEMMNIHLSNDNITADVPKELLGEARAVYRDGAERPRIGVDLKFTAIEGENMTLKASDRDGNTAFASAGLPQMAQKSPVTAEGVQRQLTKTGGTPYYVADFSAEIGDDLFVPASELNALRRECLDKLSEKRGKLEKRAVYEYKPEHSGKRAEKQELYADVMNLEQLEAAAAADRVIVPIELLDKTPFNINYIPALPQIILDEAAVRRRLQALPPGTEVYSSTLGGLRLIKEAGLVPRGDFGLNVSNAAAADMLAKEARSLTLSPELSLGEIEKIAVSCPVPVEILAYGRQTVMVSRACIIRGVRGKCDCRPIMLKDKTGAQFPVYGDPETHLNTIFNSRPTFMADRLRELRRCGAAVWRLSFTDEGPERVREIIDMYRCGGKSDSQFTRGYF